MTCFSSAVSSDSGLLRRIHALVSAMTCFSSAVSSDSGGSLVLRRLFQIKDSYFLLLPSTTRLTYADVCYADADVCYADAGAIFSLAAV